MNDDGVVNELDIQDFFACMLGGATECNCADLDDNGAANVANLGPFVSCLVTGACD